jgi:hypothetical protein
MPFITSSIKPTFPGWALSCWRVLVVNRGSLPPTVREKSTAYAGTHRSKTTSKSVIRGRETKQNASTSPNRIFARTGMRDYFSSLTRCSARF